jgi:Sec-independent protein secretion pathway component TatC
MTFCLLYVTVSFVCSIDLGPDLSQPSQQKGIQVLLVQHQSHVINHLSLATIPISSLMAMLGNGFCYFYSFALLDILMMHDLHQHMYVNQHYL